MQIGVFASDQISIENDQVWCIKIKDLLEYLDGMNVLLRSP